MMPLSDYILRSFLRGLAWRTARAVPVWLAAAILVILFLISLRPWLFLIRL
jgi:hypothetical protein